MKTLITQIQIKQEMIYPACYCLSFCNSLSFELTLFFISVGQGKCHWGETSLTHVLDAASLWKYRHMHSQLHTHTHTHGHTHTCSVMSSESDGAPSCRLKKRCLFHLRQITISPGLDSSGLSLWNGIPPHALQIYLLFYLPGQAHGKIIPNTCRALSGTLE